MLAHNFTLLNRIGLLLGLLYLPSLHGQGTNRIGESQIKYLDAIHDSLNLYRNGENNQRMAYWLGELQEILKANPEFDERGRHLANYHLFSSIHLFNTVHYQAALTHTDSALSLLETENYPGSRTAILSQRANVFTQLGLMAEANQAYKQTLASFDEWEKDIDSVRYYGVTLNWTNCLTRLGQYDQALEYLQLTRNYFMRIDHRLYWAIAENNLGELYREVFHENEKAKKHYLKAKDLNEELANNFQLGQNLNNLGIVHEGLGQIDSAVYFFNQAIAVRQKIGDLSNAASSMHGLAMLYAKKGQMQKALAIFRQIYQISTEYKIAKGLYYASQSIGSVFLKLNQLDSAEHWLKRALDYGERFNVIEEGLPVLNEMVELYERKGQFREALEYHRQMKTVHDSLLIARNKESLLSLKSNIEREAAEKENKFLRELNGLKEEQIDQQKSIIAYTSLAVILFIILSLLLISSLKKQREVRSALMDSKDELERQYQRLSLSEKSLAQANQNKDRILSVLGHDLRSPLASLSALLGALSAQTITREELLSFIERLKVQTDDSLLALESVLSWAQAHKESGASLRAEVLHVKKYVEESFQVYAPGARAKDLQMDFESSGKLESLYADPAMFRSMLGNLLSNAIKFSKEKGSIRVSLMQEAGFNLLQVCDEGVGMSKERLDQLNQSEGSLPSATGTLGERGTGIGLSLVKDFVRMHQGKLEFILRPEGGVCAKLYLPVNRAN